MPSGAFSVRVIRRGLLAVALFTASSFASVTAEHRVGLDADVLARSRGGNQGNALTQTPCNGFNGNAPCLVVNNACVTCTVTTYTDVTGAGASYFKRGAQSCGNNWSGPCDANFNCDTTGGNKVGVCNLPNAVYGQNF